MKVCAGDRIKNITLRLFLSVQKNSRKHRKNIFDRYISPDKNDRILDLGGNNGAHIADVLGQKNDVTVADISRSALDQAEKKYGFKTVLIDGGEKLPFPDKSFDIVFCSSVIEHVSIDENMAWQIHSGRTFSEKALKKQELFAKEISRVGKKYFVQTPNKYFPFEPHMRLPLVNYMPRPVLMQILKMIRKYGILKRVRISRFIPTCNLLGMNNLKYLFPGSMIVKERFLFLVKSLIAIKI
ncbi:MAG: class I SAM-dependent methyltransferase [Elusimicrobia bacterium]|nr:class I SAM-dependent methyltransferase [Elusimicrobiota bacterium]